MLQFFTIITTITGVFTILDLFVEKNAKNKVAEYVFGFGTVDLRTFETSVITALISPFKKDGAISFSRVLWRCSLTVFLIVYIVSLLTIFKFSPEFYSENSITSKFSSLLLTLVLGVLSCWPFDCWSLWITNKLFVDRKSETVLGVVFRIALDVFLTVLPLLAAISFLFSLESIINKNSLTQTIINHSVAAFVVNLIGSLLITVLQVLTLLIGILVRVVLRGTKINQHLAMVSRANEFPFSFVGLVFGITTAVFTGILS